jgi:hypothetical protein
MQCLIVDDCLETSISTCDQCDRPYCEDHCGQRGGDRQVQDVGAVAYPSLCTECCERN